MAGRALTIILGLLLVGCSPGDRDEIVTHGGFSTLDDGGTGSGYGDEDDEDDDGGTGGPKFDTPDGGDSAGDGNDGEGCKKVDFLFVVDNSGSMAQEQANLANSFPGFIDTIKEELSQVGDDYNIMVVDSDQNPFQGCVDGCAPADMASCYQYPDLCVCSNTDGLNPVKCVDAWASPFGSACDNALGAGVVFPRGGGASMMDCDVENGHRFATKGQSDLEDTFACMTRVGTSGDGDERPMSAMVAAVAPSLTGPGGCNEGFVRDDAILVVTILSDAGDGSSSDAASGNPGAWRDALVAAKNGNQDAISVLGIMSDHDVNGGSCPDPGWGSNPKLREFVQLFGDRGLLGSICEPDLTPFFVEAVETVIGSTCEDFVPEG
jgi:hypothetical protein